jgi:hypothetical protein
MIKKLSNQPYAPKCEQGVEKSTLSHHMDMHVYNSAVFNFSIAYSIDLGVYTERQEWWLILKSRALLDK